MRNGMTKRLINDVIRRVGLTRLKELSQHDGFISWREMSSFTRSHKKEVLALFNNQAGSNGVNSADWLEWLARKRGVSKEACVAYLENKPMNEKDREKLDNLLGWFAFDEVADEIKKGKT